MGCTSPSTKKDQDSQKAKLEKLRATKQYKELEIEIGDNFFSPKEATVEEGTIVIWTNKGNMLHDVRWDNAPASDHIGGDIKADLKNKDFSSKTMGTGDINVALFDKVGKFPYQCHFHGYPGKGQWGSITVTQRVTK